MRTTKELIADLENVLIYELQHIPVCGGYDDGKVKYFWESELAFFIEDGMKLYDDEESVVLFASIRCFENVVKDIDDKRPRVMFVFEGNIEKSRKALNDLLNDYRNVLADKHS